MACVACGKSRPTGHPRGGSNSHSGVVGRLGLGCDAVKSTEAPPRGSFGPSVAEKRR